LGHVIGHEHSDGDDVMGSHLETGVRVLPTLEPTTVDDQPARLSDRRSAVSAGLFSGASLTAFDTPPTEVDRENSISSPLTALRSQHLDTLFARLDDDQAVVITEEDRASVSDRDESPEQSEDALDLWSLLYGLE
jgi:hypothetical protein